MTGATAQLRLQNKLQINLKDMKSPSHLRTKPFERGWIMRIFWLLPGRRSSRLEQSQDQCEDEGSPGWRRRSRALCCFWRVLRDVWPPQPSGGQWGFGELWGHPMNPLCCCPKRNQGLAFKPLRQGLRKCVEMKKFTLGLLLTLSNPLGTAAHSRSLFSSIFRGF